MAFRKLKNDSGSRYKWPALRRRGDGIDLMIDVHDVDRLGLGPEARVWIEVDDECEGNKFLVRVSAATAEDNEAWKCAKGKFGDVRVTMGHRAFAQDVQGHVPATSTTVVRDGDVVYLLLEFDPANRIEEQTIGELELLPS